MREPRAALCVLVATAAFGLALLAREAVNPWLTASAAALLVLVIGAPRLVTITREIRALDWRQALAASGLGAALVAATHVAFALVSRVSPGLIQGVPELYRAIEAQPGAAIGAPFIILVVCAEELAWRGALIDLLSARYGRALVVALSTAAYATPQLVGGAWELVAAALVLGAVFSLQRVIVGRVADPLISHAAWSVGVFAIWPL